MQREAAGFLQLPSKAHPSIHVRSLRSAAAAAAAAAATAALFYLKRLIYLSYDPELNHTPKPRGRRTRARAGSAYRASEAQSASVRRRAPSAQVNFNA